MTDVKIASGRIHFTIQQKLFTSLPADIVSCGFCIADLFKASDVAARNQN